MIRHKPKHVKLPRKQDGICCLHKRCSDLIAELHRDFPATNEEGPLKLHIHKPNSVLPTPDVIFASRMETFPTRQRAQKVRHKTRVNLKVIEELEEHKKLYEREKKFENKLKRNWPAQLIRFTHWRAPFTVGKGGAAGVETDTQVHDLSNATCFGVFIRFHENLLNDL